MRRAVAGTGLVECDREQARTEQQKAGCGDCEESIGYEVMITHGAPFTLDAGPSLLKISESAFG
jgi:hypothetical protein